MDDNHSRFLLTQNMGKEGLSKLKNNPEMISSFELDVFDLMYERRRPWILKITMYVFLKIVVCPKLMADKGAN